MSNRLAASAVSANRIAENIAADVAADIVVVNYNGARLLPGLLAALAAQTRRDFRLILVDNGSADGSAQIVEQIAGGLPFAVQVVRNAANAGFGLASNQGLRRGDATWVAMLNNDTRPEPAWLEHLLDATDQEPRLGMVGSKLLRMRNPGQIDSAGIAVDWAGIAWDWRGGDLDDTGERDLAEIFGPCGGAALYARAMLDEVGAFDGDFFAYLEDVDLAWRARLAGWRAYLQPQARACTLTLPRWATPRRANVFCSDATRYGFWSRTTRTRGLCETCRASWRMTPSPWATAWRRAGTSPPGAGAWRAGVALPRCLAKRRRIQARPQDIDNWRRGMSPVEPPWDVPRRYAHLRVDPAR